MLNVEIKLIDKEDFNKYKNDIDRIHEENAYPTGGYLLDDDYIINADKIFLVLNGKEVIGYLSVAHKNTFIGEGDTFYVNLTNNNILIKQFAIKKEYQKMRIGTMLLNSVKGYATSNKIEVIYLYTMKDNMIAKRFYEKNGFVFSGTWDSDEYKKIKPFQSHFYSYNLPKDSV